MEYCLATISEQLKDEEESYKKAISNNKTQVWQLMEMQERIKSLKIFLKEMADAIIN